MALICILGQDFWHKEQEGKETATICEERNSAGKDFS